jgi:hypothetical protein
MRTHAIDIDQPPDMGSSPIAVMERQPMIVAVTLAAKSNARRPKHALSEAATRAVHRGAFGTAWLASIARAG